MSGVTGAAAGQRGVAWHAPSLGRSLPVLISSRACWQPLRWLAKLSGAATAHHQYAKQKTKPALKHPQTHARRSLARVGLHFGVPRELQAVEWYGRGPQECYPDRKSGALLRRHAVGAVRDLHVPYIFPSEFLSRPFGVHCIAALLCAVFCV